MQEIFSQAKVKMRVTKGAKKFVKNVTAAVMAAKPKVTVAKKVATLARQVKKLNKVSYEKVNTVSQYAAGDNLTSSYNAYNCSRIYNYCFPVFGTSGTEISEVNKAYLNSKDIFVSIRQAGEPNLVRCSMFLVSLKDQGATSTIFDPASRQLVLSQPTDYTPSSAYAEQILMNSKEFTVHATRRFTMGYEGSAGPAADTYSQRRFHFKISPKQKLIENPAGNFFNNSSFSSPMDPSQNYFIVIFNDNASLDLEFPKVDITVHDHWAVPN